MRLTRLFAIALVALGFSLAAPAAHAVTFTFAELGSNTPNAPFSSCFTGGDRCQSTLTFDVGSVRVTVSGVGTPPPGSTTAVIQDRNPVNGGLGVVYKSGTTYSEGGLGDEVNTGETLVLTFTDLGGLPLSVSLTGATFFNEDHVSLAAGKTFAFAVGLGLPTSHLFTAPFGNTGTSFSFGYGGTTPEDFYLASVNVEVAPIPEPGTLLLLGSGITGLAMRRRRSRK